MVKNIKVSEKLHKELWKLKTADRRSLGKVVAFLLQKYKENQENE